jgi:cupin 2 domain-containing protein
LHILENIYNIPINLSNSEFLETLFSGKNIAIERIISTGQTTPSGEWYDQEQDEWVILLQGEAELSFADFSRFRLRSGDYLFIRAHQQHRVEYTTVSPPCIWLAIHIYPQSSREKI